MVNHLTISAKQCIAQLQKKGSASETLSLDMTLIYKI